VAIFIGFLFTAAARAETPNENVPTRKPAGSIAGQFFFWEADGTINLSKESQKYCNPEKSIAIAGKVNSGQTYGICCVMK